MAGRLCCKPLPGMHSSELLFLLTDSTLQGTIAFRSLDLDRDLDTIHDWVNQPYARRYWQLNGDKQSLHKIYRDILKNQLSHSFIGLFNNKIVCQLDCYEAAAGEIKNHVGAAPGHCGVHILMCPPRQSLKGLTVAILKAFIQFFYSFSEARTLYGEPDQRNTTANLAALRAGFEFQKIIQLSYKTANLYSITRDQFFQSLQYDK